MRNAVIFSFALGASVGSLITYFYMKRKEHKPVEYIEPEIVEREKEATPELEDRVQRTIYNNLVNNMYSPKTNQAPKSPYPISEKAFHESYRDYDKCLMTYYADDGTIANDDVIIDDIDYTIGVNNLGLFGSTELEDPNVMYIRNEHTGCDYQITWADKSYEDDYPDYPEDSE